MGFDRVRVDISCDECGMESEPEELTYSPTLGGGYGLSEARKALRSDGWLVSDGDRLTCPDCVSELRPATSEGGGV